MTSNWENMKFIDIIELIGGGTPKTSIPEYWNGDIPWLSVKDFNNDNRYVYVTEKSITTLGLQNSSTKLLRKDDIIISARGTVGEIAMIPFSMAFNQSCYGMRAKDFVDKTFLYYLTKFCINKLKAISHGSVFDTITRDTFANIDICIPNIKTQQKIAKVLSAIDDKIELNNSINNNLEQQAQAIFKSWFVDFEPFSGTMPDDWTEGVLSDIVDFMNGYAFKSSELLNTPENNCYDVFKQGHINRGGGFNINGTKSWYPKDKTKNLEKYVLKKGDILMAMTDMKDNVAILGNTALMEIDNKYIVNQRVGLLRCKNDIGISYPHVYILTNSSDFLYDLRKRANSGVQVNLSSTEIKNSEVTIAPKEINEKFDKIVKPLFEQIFNNDIENQKLIQLRDTLLPKLMSGEIDVDKVEV